MDEVKIEKEVKHHKKLIIGGIFLVIVFSLIYFAFFPDNFSPSLTGKTIFNKVNESEIIEINAVLTMPEKFELDQEIEKIEIKSKNPESIFYLGKENKFDLKNLNEARIAIEGYDGEALFNSEKISLRGYSKKVFINGLSSIPVNKDKIKISFDKPLFYNNLKLNKVYLKPLSYTTTGEVTLNKGEVSINLDREKLNLGDFKGNIELENNKIILSGHITQISIKGKLDITSK